MKHKKRFFVLVLLIVLLVSVYHFILKDELTFERLNSYKAGIRQFIDGHYILSVSCFIVIYIIVASLSLPGLPLLTMLAAFAYGVIEAVFYVVIGATIGATIAFLLSRYLIGFWVQQRLKNKLKEFNTRLAEEGSYYLLGLRFVPVVPFTWLNLACGLIKLPVFTFIWTTVLGIIPGTLVAAFAGAQLGKLDSIEGAFSQGLITALFLLGAFAFLPVVVKALKRRSQRKND
jgi:uncharacterized membrane protein YdjX (TVP38/TMEM64 family)